jgi:hypothetical protein
MRQILADDMRGGRLRPIVIDDHRGSSILQGCDTKGEVKARRRGLSRRPRGGFARLFLFTARAADLYAMAGWTVVETFAKHGEVFSIMEKHL